MKKIYEKLSISFSRFFFPILFKLFFLLKINRRAINYFSEKSFFLNNNHDFKSLIYTLLKEKKIIALDVGAQGGFNSDCFLSTKYNIFFQPILVEPIKEEAEKLKKNDKYVVAKALWSSRSKKTINVLGNRLGSSSMYEPRPDLFDLHNIKKKDYQNYNVTSKIEVQCETLKESLKNLNIKKLDYLKIDTQGAELEILKGAGDFRPLLIKIESHVHSMYKDVPDWNELLNFLYKLNYVAIDWKGIGSHATRIPAEMDMIFIPNFKNEIGKKLICENENKFVSLMLIFGQISLLKIIASNNNFKTFDKIKNLQDLYFN
jgi:FkbM family methyltransferase